MSETAKSKPRFPIVLTIATLIAFAILCGLGTWQVKRLAWKEDLLARIETLKTVPAIPLAQALTRADKGEDVAWTRVETGCRPVAPGASFPLVYGVRDGQMVWRPQIICGSDHGPIIVDLGVAEGLTGQVQPDRHGVFGYPSRVTGVLVTTDQLGGKEREGLLTDEAGKSPKYVLMAEATTPALPRVTPAPLPAEISNRHLEYALTWFGLAVTLLFIYAAMLWRRMRP
ncbi:hypothetical protein SGCZBJ_00440 [Caulobacter zeae]|uniref:SURF1-like protein n=1 Tax=Caulobacter zeae TaxID=2055137 RepID=A0A2N5DSB1_9CAUL|nr:SURF1 family cytochrome oxidase biogenesis protein [Caulobacter zeae]PLR28943.1 hypothetical protein SGCZBJ_00440 [Caulobacter zeae]